MLYYRIEWTFARKKNHRSFICQINKDQQDVLAMQCIEAWKKKLSGYGPMVVATGIVLP